MNNTNDIFFKTKLALKLHDNLYPNSVPELSIDDIKLMNSNFCPSCKKHVDINKFKSFDKLNLYQKIGKCYRCQ